MEAIRRLFTYDYWAIARILDALKSAPGGNASALRLLAHLLVAERIWLLRLKGEDTTTVDMSPELSLVECARLANENQRAYAGFLASLGEDELDSVVTYRNSKGLEFHTPVIDILTHVALHGTYHRGQIATAMRVAGQIPAGTDFITFIREKATGSPA